MVPQHPAAPPPAVLWRAVQHRRRGASDRSMAVPSSMHSQPTPPKFGLAHWMRRVLRECAGADMELSPGVVHDLRVALRRCRSMARSVMEVDPSPDWRGMRKAARGLFRPLGHLRDSQVMLEWVQRLSPADDPVRQRMAEILAGRERELTACARRALAQFDRKRWKRFAALLPERVRRVPLDPLAFTHLALERYDEAHALHRRARRSRSRVAYHRLRIGLKRFRYTVENFLPELSAAWEADLKRVQDLLGDVHDLDVLRASLRTTGPVFDAAERSRWFEAIDRERQLRLEEYRRLTRGKASLWARWRAGLPDGDELGSTALAKLGAWASFRGPEVGERPPLADRALQLFDGLGAAGVPGPFTSAHARRVLNAAALLHDVGRVDGKRGHHKRSYRAIRALRPPLGWSRDDMELVALVARYHRGAPPRDDHAAFRALPQGEGDTVRHLAGVLRVALAFGRDREARVTGLEVQNSPEAIVIVADTAGAEGPLTSEVLRRKWLLEIACQRPVIVRFRGAPPPLLGGC